MILNLIFTPIIYIKILEKIHVFDLTLYNKKNKSRDSGNGKLCFSRPFLILIQKKLWILQIKIEWS